MVDTLRMQVGREGWWRSRAGTAATAAIALALGAGYLVLAFRIVFSMRIGPTAVALLPGRGVHTGDVLALPTALLGVTFLAVAVTALASLRRRRPAVVVPLGWERARRQAQGLSRAA